MTMLAIASFWLLLILPGYALLRRLSPASLEGGGLGNVALSYLATFALLSPVSIAGYLFQLPLWVLSAAIVASVVIAVVWLGRELLRGQRRLPAISPLAVLVTLVVTADMVLGLRKGSTLGGDARYHMARVRMLLASGFNDYDPLLASGREQVYHTNLYHALMAASAQLSRLFAPDAWAYSWFWAKLAAAGAAYYLGWTLFGKRWIGWLAALVFVLSYATLATLPYPNNIAVYWLLAMGLAFGVQAFALEGGVRPAIGLGATALALVQLHALYFVFAVMLIAPFLGLRLGISLLRRRPGRRDLIVALLALGLGAPWFASAAWERIHPVFEGSTAGALATAEAPAQPAPPRRDWRSKGFIIRDDGMLSLDPRGFWDIDNQNVQLFIALLVGLLSRRRAQFAALGIAVGTAMAVLYVPQVCTPVARAAGAPWIVHRLAMTIALMHDVVFPVALFLPFLERFSRGWLIALQGIAVAVSAYSAWHYGVDSERSTRKQYLAKARSGTELRTFLDWHEWRHKFFAAAIPVGAVAAVPTLKPTDFADFLIDCDCYPLAIAKKRGSRGVDDMAERRQAVALLLGARGNLHMRLVALRRYGVRHLIFLGHAPFTSEIETIYHPVTRGLAQIRGVTVLTLDIRHGRPP
jgi:hypothetical protein